MKFQIASPETENDVEANAKERIRQKQGTNIDIANTRDTRYVRSIKGTNKRFS